jgi:hypothetical protein
MSLHALFYEFEANRENIEFLVGDIGITQNGAPAVRNVAENLIDLMNRGESTYAKVEILGKPGLMLRFSRGLRAERLPHPIEGAHAFIHPSSEGHLELEEFKTYFEASLSAHGIPYIKYE